MIGLRVDKLNFSGLFVEVRFKRTDSSIGFRAGSDQRPTLTSLLVRPSGLLYCFPGHLAANGGGYEKALLSCPYGSLFNPRIAVGPLFARKSVWRCTTMRVAVAMTANPVDDLTDTLSAARRRFTNQVG